MKNIYYVYALIDPRTNLPFYIGKGHDERMYVHLSETKDSTRNIHKFNKIQAISSAGLKVIVEKLYCELDEPTAYYLEEFLIAHYGRKGYDENGILSNVCLSLRPPSPKGKPKSEEHKRKISQSCKNRNLFHSTETKMKISSYHKDKPKSEEQKRKMSEAKKGKPSHRQGKTLSEEHKQKIKESWIKRKLLK